MQIQIQIEVNESKIFIRSPYSTRNNEVWRELGGKYKDDKWGIPDTPTARERIAEMFGAKSDSVAVLVDSRLIPDGGIIQIGGYVLAQRRGRDYAVQLAQGVTLHNGRLPSSGGSRANPRVCADDGEAVFRVIVREDFAKRHGLPLADTATPAPTIEI
jgi:hypothetical protein